eukprot:6214603-Pleurochrysis_carterae.AAC.1
MAFLLIRNTRSQTQDWIDKEPLAKICNVHQLVHAIQTATPSSVARKAKETKEAKAEANKKTKAAQQVEKKKAAGLAKKQATAAAPAAASPFPAKPRVDPILIDDDVPSSSVADAVRARIAALAAQEAEEAALLEKLEAAEKAAMERAAMKKDLLKRIEMAEQSEPKDEPTLQPTALPTPRTPAVQHPAAMPNYLQYRPPSQPGPSSYVPMMPAPHAYTLPPTPDSERAICKNIRVLQAARAEDGVTGLASQIAGLQYELETKRRDRKRS